MLSTFATQLHRLRKELWGQRQAAGLAVPAPQQRFFPLLTAPAEPKPDIKAELKELNKE